MSVAFLYVVIVLWVTVVLFSVLLLWRVIVRVLVDDEVVM